MYKQCFFLFQVINSITYSRYTNPSKTPEISKHRINRHPIVRLILIWEQVKLILWPQHFVFRRTASATTQIRWCDKITGFVPEATIVQSSTIIYFLAYSKTIDTTTRIKLVCELLHLPSLRKIDRNYPNLIVGFVSFRVGLTVANVLHHFHSFVNTPKHGVFVIQPGLLK